MSRDLSSPTDVEDAVATILRCAAGAVDAEPSGEALVTVRVDAVALSDAGTSAGALEDVLQERAPAGTRLEVTSR
jgi:hypothetical protein